MIPVNEPLIGEKEIEYVNECLRTGWISSAGRFIEEFEQKWAAYCGMKYGIAMSNGTTALQAAVGLGQMERMDEIITKKRWMGKAYTERLQSISVLQLPVEESWAKQVYWMYGIVLDESTGLDAVRFAQKLKEKGVETRLFFLGMHEQPVFQTPPLPSPGGRDTAPTLPSPGGRDTGRGMFTGEKYPVAERIARQGLYLPSGLTLTETQIDLVCDTVKAILGN